MAQIRSLDELAPRGICLGLRVVTGHSRIYPEGNLYFVRVVAGLSWQMRIDWES